MRRLALASFLLLASLALYLSRRALREWMFNLTGEESLLGQVRGLEQLTSDLIRPRLDLAPEAPMTHTGVNPFGVNTFLQQEVEPAKRERQVQMIAQAGFHWLRQEFPWYDIEIHAKGDFEDRRFEPHRSAWEKYDHIVELAGRYGLEIIARLSAPPAWSRADGDAAGAFAPPDDFADFADYAEAVAARYRGRVRYFQVWNEPNIYPEWGERPVDPEAYTDLLCRTYRRLKAVDPEIVVLSGALAPTNELTGRDLNDFIFLQRMYAAGAARCFDILSMQGYGLWSGPTDRRMRPIVVNYGRNQFIRDLMVKNGDAGKAVWISEMNWNATPAGPQGGGESIPPVYGQVTLEQQARYAPLAYQRAQAEWPWVGVVNFWFFKRADDSEKGEAWYYFRMLEPDFTPLPVYDAMKTYTARPPVMYPGYYQEDHWAVEWDGDWELVDDVWAVLGRYRESSGPALLRFTFHGTDLSLVVVKGREAGALAVQVDGGEPRQFDLRSDSEQEFGVLLPLARGLRDGEHSVLIRTQGSGPAAIDGFIIRQQRFPLAAAWIAGLVVLGAAGVWRGSRAAIARSRARQPRATAT